MASDIYSGISSGREHLTMKYENTAPPDEEEYMAALLAARRRDVENGYSTVGVHRDDLKLSLNDLDARAFGSQGQQRSIALSLKLAEGFLLREELGENPVFLLDDVMSELDTARQDYILNQVTDVQVFITCCDPATVGALKNGRSFKLEAGSIVRE
ncbi:DNA replication and repair protein RecF [bioreactor metagenome]|uniref:DNA replication and repair protein RecF n=1 Tax=bioreactor metagenome TaxID=1076179 RepID=A0A645GAR4_9ZZZZ